MNSTTTRTLVAGTLLAGLATPALADDVASPSLQQRLQNVTDRLQELERSSTTPEGRLVHEWETLLEFEAARAEDGDGNTTSEMALATMELGVTSRIRDGLETNVLLLHEEGEDFGVDSATIDANLAESEGRSTDLVAGLQYLPFGDYYSHFVSDPLTLELGETQEGAVRLHHRADSMYAGVWLANGKTSDTIDNQGVYAHFSLEQGPLSFGFGGAWTSSIGDADGIVDTAEESGIPGYSAMAEAVLGDVTFIGEHVAAADSFDAAQLAFNGNGATPTANALELAYTLPVGAHELSVAAGLQGSSEAVALGLPESRRLVGLGLVIPGGELSLEYSSDSYYAESDGGDGETSNALTAQLAVAF